MKVCTDACLFGAWVAEHWKDQLDQEQLVLDVGTGTGLLSLMLAQALKSRIEGVELDEGAWQQTQLNFEQSPWPERLSVVHTDILQYNAGHRYHAIISNPPFFENGLRSGEPRRNQAKHDTSLRLQTLFPAIKNLLLNKGCFALLLPPVRISEAEALASENGFFIQYKTRVNQQPGGPIFRVMYIFTTSECIIQEDEMNIRENGDYSETFSRLLAGYYLRFPSAI